MPRIFYENFNVKVFRMDQKAEVFYKKVFLKSFQDSQ